MSQYSEFPKGSRVVIGNSDNDYARQHVGKAGVVVGMAPILFRLASAWQAEFLRSRHFSGCGDDVVTV